MIAFDEEELRPIAFPHGLISEIVEIFRIVNGLQKAVETDRLGQVADNPNDAISFYFDLFSRPTHGIETITDLDT